MKGRGLDPATLRRIKLHEESYHFTRGFSSRGQCYRASFRTGPAGKPSAGDVACNFAWRSGKVGRSLDEALAAVRRFLRGEPDEFFDLQFLSELLASWRRGRVALRQTLNVGTVSAAVKKPQEDRHQ